MDFERQPLLAQTGVRKAGCQPEASGRKQIIFDALASHLEGQRVPVTSSSKLHDRLKDLTSAGFLTRFGPESGFADFP
jgi:hypothetical protein